MEELTGISGWLLVWIRQVSTVRENLDKTNRSWTFESHRPLAAPRNEQPSMHVGMRKEKNLDINPFHSTQGLLPAIPPWSPSLKKEDPKDGFSSIDLTTYAFLLAGRYYLGQTSHSSVS